MTMGGPRYSEDQLHALRDSPLVRKPDSLPSISQWMDVPHDQTTVNTHTNNTSTARRTRGLRDSEGGVPTDQRPLINPMGQFGRRQSTQPGEDTVLGPPKLSFLSASRNPAKTVSETKERTGIVSVDGDHLGDRFPREKNERWSRDRDTDRTREKGYTNGRRNTRDDGEGWTSVKSRKSLSQEDFERFGRNGDRARDKHDGDNENDGSSRRGNRDRPDQRWSRRDDTKEDGAKSNTAGGWRDRDRERERERERGRDRDRGWGRPGGGGAVEEDPEWMDTKIEKKEMKPRTQEDFQRWKEQMKAKDTPVEEKDELKEFPTEQPFATSSTILNAPSLTPNVEPTGGILFGNWGRDKAIDTTPTESTTNKSKTDKKSRFMNMFAKPEESAAPEVIPQVPLPNVPPMEANADKEGFQRILQMLGGVSIGSPQVMPPDGGISLDGSRQTGGVSLDMHQQTTPPEPQAHRSAPRTIEQQSMLENILSQRTSAQEPRIIQQSRFGGISPENATPEQFRHPRPEATYPEEHFSPQQPPSRNSNSQDVNLAVILNARSRDESHRDQATKQRERDFLLTLMQQPSRATPPQQLNQNLPRPMHENQNLSFFSQSRQQQPQQPKGRGGAPPGFMEDPRMFNENKSMRRENERREQELRQQLGMHHLHQQQQHQQEAMRQKQQQRMPMGFPNHEEGALQRRNTSGDPRLNTNMGIPSQPVPDGSYMGPRGQQGMPPTPGDRPNIAPPPGFGGPMRQPPGLGGPPLQQHMGPGPSPGGPPNFSVGNTPLNHPPGFPPGNMRGMGFPGPSGLGGNGMQGPPPQGFFPSPGFGGSMMGGGGDPRMMFEQFGGPGGPPRQGRPGPPGMY